jgi:hypothetical protein
MSNLKKILLIHFIVFPLAIIAVIFSILNGNIKMGYFLLGVNISSLLFSIIGTIQNRL